MSDTADKTSLRYTTDELCEVYLNEDVHTEHVTRLALHLFDAVQPWTGLNRYDRRLLEAAARLHDVGYAIDPRNHMKKSVEIVRTQGLEGYQERQVPYICAAIALHQNAVRSVLKSPLVRELAHPLRAMRIGAILRIADGLDSGHIQDTSITSIKRSGNTIVVTVHTPWSTENIMRADAKAGLWRELFTYDIRFEAEKIEASRRVSLCPGGDNLYEAIRRYAYWYFKTMRLLEGGCKAGVSTDPLHDFRVALRRFRTLLKLFRKPLKGTWAGDIEKRLGAIGDALGPARDFDVWQERLRALGTDPVVARSRVWKRYMSHQQTFLAVHLAQVRQVLDGARYKNVMQEIAYFLRIQLPEKARTEPDRMIEPYAAEKLWRGARAIWRTEIPGGSWEVEDFHDFRKACRRDRYAAECFGEALGPRTRRWGKTLKAMADALGDLHDADVGLERVMYEAVPAPRVLVTALRTQRAAALKSVDAAWLEIKDETFADKIRKELRRHRT